jgi:predicted ester cyclase
MAVDMKQSHRRLFEEAFGKGNLAVFDEICDPGYRSHDPLTGDNDLDGTRNQCRTYRDAFPDLTPTLIASYAEGDVVITQWRMSGTHRGELMGIPPTGTRCTAEGITIGRFRSGKLVEEWTQWDALGLLRQLGVSAMQPTPGARGPGVQPHA